MGLLLKLLALAVLIGLTTAKPNYLLAGPKVVTANTIETFCVTLEDLNGVANVHLKLTDTEGVVYASTETQLKTSGECVELVISDAASQLVVAHLHLKITSKSEPEWEIEDVKEVAVSNNKFNIPLIQTDRALYRPGDLIKFRVFNLDGRLFPITEPISRVLIEDPKGNTVTEWKDVVTTQGVHQFEFEVPEDTGDGIWTILVEPKINELHQQTFEVQEFIVPEFHVEIFNPDDIFLNTPYDFSNQKIAFIISSKYGDLRRVDGFWKAVVEVQSIRPTWFGKVPLSTFIQEKEGELKNGRAMLLLDGNSLGLDRHDGGYNLLNVTVTVTDKETGISITESWIRESQSRRYHMALLSPSTFKHGLPYYGVFKVVALDKKSITGTNIQICYDPKFAKSEPEDKREAKSSKLCRQSVADDTGIFNVDIFPTDPRVTSYIITVQVVKDDLTPLYTQILSIQAVYSPSDSFLSFIKPTSPLPCNSDAKLTFQYTATGDMNFDLHYLVISGGQLLHSGTKKVSFYEKDNLELPSSIIHDKKSSILDKTTNEWKNKLIGEDYLQLSLNSSLAPAASVLAYYVREDGEVVTAAVNLDIEMCFPNPVQLSAELMRSLWENKWELKIKGGKNSICGLSVVDISTFSDRAKLQFSESKVFDRVMKNHIRSYVPPFQAIPDYLYCKEPETKSHNVRKRSETWRLYTTPYLDAISAFDQAGLLVMSNLKLQTRPCIEEIHTFEPELMMADSPVPSEPSASPRRINSKSDLMGLEVFSSYVPKTREWELITLDENGEASKLLPHESRPLVHAQIACVSEAYGFGLSPIVDII